MSLLMTRVRAVLRRLWRGSPPLSALSLLMLPVLAACLLGLWLDPRSIAGAPAWLKPAKFAGSIAIYGATLSWILGYLPARVRRGVGWISALAFGVEMGIIALQAARGERSHFNTATLLDAALFAIMGAGIVLQTLASAVAALAVWRQQFADRALGWALRLGLVIAVFGASIGGLMTRPTPAQLDGMRTARPSLVGAHTVGGPDGGAGLPALGWSREHGDLRVPHFLGLHALQALPLLALATRRRESEPRRVRRIVFAAASYAGLVGLLLWQALRGRALLAPDALGLALLACWLVLTLALQRWVPAPPARLAAAGAA